MATPTTAKVYEEFEEQYPEPHFCESPYCLVEPGCVGYRTLGDPLGTGYYSSPEEMAEEERGMTEFEEQLRASFGPGALLAGEEPPF